MKKDNFRDYTVDALRYYSMCGKPNSAELRRMKDVLPPGRLAALLDLEAVDHMLHRLEGEEYGITAVHCVEMVYFVSPSRIASRSQISERVKNAAKALCVGESSVYRALRRARTLFAIERGLRLDEPELIIPR